MKLPWATAKNKVKMSNLDDISIDNEAMINHAWHFKLFVLWDKSDFIFLFPEYLPDVIEAFQGDEYDEYTLEEAYFNQLEEERLAKKRRKKKKKNRRKYYDDDYYYDSD